MSTMVAFMRSSSLRVRHTRHYYSSQRSFEQSIDVYKPIDPSPPSEEDEALPLVVLVVGSGWLGHRAFIYGATSWWNSAGPKTLARLGCVCVCVRHRGAFFVLPEARVILSFLVVAAAGICASWGKEAACAAVVFLTLLWGLLALGAQGSATFEDMQHDVADALAWVNRHRDGELLMLSQNSEKRVSFSQRALVFGGYSSGGHVASTVLQRPDLLESKGLPPPEKLCDAIIMVSGVLAVRPPTQKNPKDSKTARSPYWLTDLTMQIVFGKTNSALVPSPLEGRKPNLPHFLIGCAEEVFGLDWLDLFFCSRAYKDALDTDGIPSRYVEIKSDHWRILGSQDFSRAALRELRFIAKEYANGRVAVCDICRKRSCIRVRSDGPVSPALLCREVRQE